MTAIIILFALPVSFIAIGIGSAFFQCFDNKAIAITVGTFAVFIGAYIGAIGGFYIGRFVARD